MTDVLLTYSWNRVGYNILLSLARKGLKVITADESKTNICSCSKYAHGSERYPGPFSDPEHFIDHPQKTPLMGGGKPKICEQKFDVKLVNKDICDIISI